MTSHIDLTLTLGQDLWISEHFMWHRLLKHFFPGSSQIFWFLSLCSQHSPSEQTPLLQIKCFLQVITNHCKPFSFLTISYQQEIFLCTQQRPNLVPKYGFTKGVFFSERAIRFSNFQNKDIPKNYPELEI